MRVFLDACVLFPPLVRSLVLGSADQGLFVPLWSARVLEEWRRAVAAKQGGEAEHLVHLAQAEMRTRHPASLCAADPDLEAGVDLPDPADAHVLAAALAGGAEVLLTFNLKDFPRRTLAGHGIEARHPDGYLWELLSGHERVMFEAVEKCLRDAEIDLLRGRAALKRARLSRFGKAWEALLHAS